MKRQRRSSALFSLLAAVLLITASCAGGTESDDQADADSSQPATSPPAEQAATENDAPAAAPTVAPVRGDDVAASESIEQVQLDLNDFQFTPTTLQLPAGQPVELTILNSGDVEHEWMAGRDRTTASDAAGYGTDLIALLQPEVVGGHGYHMEMMGIHGHMGGHDEGSEAGEVGGHGMMISSEVEVEPGGEVVLRFQTPPEAMGSWEMGCFLPGHYEAGMKGTVTIGEAATAEVEAQLPAMELIAAIDYIDSAGFHSMSEDLAAGEINPRFLGTVEKVVAVTTATSWPAELQAAADTFRGDAQAFADALAAEDVEAAAAAAEDIHSSQHALSHDVFEILSSGTVTTVTPAGLIATIDYIDSAGFHSMSEDLAAGEINPRFLGTVEKVLIVTQATAWPAKLSTTSDTFVSDLEALAAALEAEDVEAAAAAAEAIHASQHDLSHQIFEGLADVTMPEMSLGGLVAGIDYVDSAGFHSMAEDLAAGEINPRFLGTVEKVIVVVEATTWPDELGPTVDGFLSDLRTLEAALEAEDVEGAASAAEAIHASQHDLSHGVFARLGGHQDDGHADSPGAQQVSLEISDWAFSGDLKVKQGLVTLTVTNTGRMPHGIYLPEFKINESVAAGETVTITFEADKPGTYRFMCNEPMCGTADQHASMHATLTVE